jgi:methyltransferase (TIGR00027 family)
VTPSTASRTALGASLIRALHARADPAPILRDDWAEDVTVIEVDHPATQRFKRERLAACGVVVPSGGHFVEADLSNETLEAALARSPFRRDRPAFFAWVGVTMYLPRETNLTTLRAMATSTSAGADVAFSYVDEVRFAPGAESDAAFERLRADVASVGEALVSGFDPAACAMCSPAWGLR